MEKKIQFSPITINCCW